MCQRQNSQQITFIHLFSRHQRGHRRKNAQSDSLSLFLCVIRLYLSRTKPLCLQERGQCKGLRKLLLNFILSSCKCAEHSKRVAIKLSRSTTPTSIAKLNQLMATLDIGVRDSVLHHVVGLKRASMRAARDRDRGDRWTINYVAAKLLNERRDPRPCIHSYTIQPHPNTGAQCKDKFINTYFLNFGLCTSGNSAFRVTKGRKRGIKVWARSRNPATDGCFLSRFPYLKSFCRPAGVSCQLFFRSHYI